MTAGSMSAERPGYAVLLAAYGSPRTLDEVEPYLREVRGGRQSPAEAVEDLRRRYRAIGGRSPLLERTTAQAAALALKLGNPAVYVGMRHWHPYIRDVLGAIRAQGHDRVVVLPLAPHYSRMSIGAYQQAVEAARDGLEIAMVREWFDEPGFLDAVANRVVLGLRSFGEGAHDRVSLVFTAHSLPARILADGDPYPEQLKASVTGVLERVGGPDARFAFQSAGRTAEPWLGPEVRDVVRELARGGSREVLVCPIGFVSDHLEVLYDIDIELREEARREGIRVERTDSLNDDDQLISALAAVASKAARDAGWA